MHLNKRYPILLSLILIFSLLAGCNLPFITEESSNIAIPSETAYDNTAGNTEEILSYLLQTMERNQSVCELFIEDKSLIDADLWLTSLPGIEEIHCSYKKIKGGYNILITLQCWDNYAIVHAYRTSDTSALSPKQLELYQKYCDVLNEYTSPNKSDYQNELAIHDYLVGHLSYVTQDDTRYNAYEALMNGNAVCSGYTECFKTFMDLLGIENSTISGESDNERHIWNEVRIDNEWYQVDVTWDDPINSTLSDIDHSYFNITDADMALDHTWDSNQVDYHIATGTKYSYANIMGLVNIASQSDLNNFITNCIGKHSTYIEFQSNQSLDIKQAMNQSNVTLSYSYKIVERINYSLYTVIFDYNVS